jgi:hypothetical protein
MQCQKKKAHSREGPLANFGLNQLLAVVAPLAAYVRDDGTLTAA